MKQSRKTPPAPPPWEVLVLVSHRMDPTTLAIASCVCKLWSVYLSSDHLWKPVYDFDFPSLSSIKLTVPDPNPSYRRLYSIARTASKRRVLSKNPSKPKLSLADLIFTIDIRDAGACGGDGGCGSSMAAGNTAGEVIVALAKPASEVAMRSGTGADLFRFEFNDVEKPPCRRVSSGVVEDGGTKRGLRITWNVVLRGCEGVFTMMDCDGEIVTTADGGSGGGEAWFSEALPAPGCCGGGFIGRVGSGIVAEMKLGFSCGGGGGGMMNVVKFSVGIMNEVEWRYLNVEDGLRYLQHFLFPVC